MGIILHFASITTSILWIKQKHQSAAPVQWQLCCPRGKRPGHSILFIQSIAHFRQVLGFRSLLAPLILEVVHWQLCRPLGCLPGHISLRSQVARQVLQFLLFLFCLSFPLTLESSSSTLLLPDDELLWWLIDTFCLFPLTDINWLWDSSRFLLRFGCFDDLAVENADEEDANNEESTWSGIAISIPVYAAEMLLLVPSILCTFMFTILTFLELELDFSSFVQAQLCRPLGCRPWHEALFGQSWRHTLQVLGFRFRLSLPRSPLLSILCPKSTWCIQLGIFTKLKIRTMYTKAFTYQSKSDQRQTEKFSAF